MRKEKVFWNLPISFVPEWAVIQSKRAIVQITLVISALTEKLSNAKDAGFDNAVGDNSGYA